MQNLIYYGIILYITDNYFSGEEDFLRRFVKEPQEKHLFSLLLTFSVILLILQKRVRMAKLEDIRNKIKDFFAKLQNLLSMYTSLWMIK
jgi:hypothetical protein